MTKRERGIAEVLLQKFLKRNTEGRKVFREEETSKQETQRFRFFYLNLRGSEFNETFIERVVRLWYNYLQKHWKLKSPLFIPLQAL